VVLPEAVIDAAGGEVTVTTIVLEVVLPQAFVTTQV
jgi:hypothetical protein